MISTRGKDSATLDGAGMACCQLSPLFLLISPFCRFVLLSPYGPDPSPRFRRYCLHASSRAPTFRIPGIHDPAGQRPVGGRYVPFFFLCSFSTRLAKSASLAGFHHASYAGDAGVISHTSTADLFSWTATELFSTTAHFTRKQRAFTSLKMTGASRRISFCTKLTPLARLAPCTLATPRSTLHPTSFGTPH